MNRKKKNLLTMIILLLLILTLTGVYVMIGRKGEETGSGTGEITDIPHSLELAGIASDDIEKVYIKNSYFEGTIVRTFVQKDVETTTTNDAGETVTSTSTQTTAVYKVEEEENFPLDADRASIIFKNIALDAAQFVTDEGELSEYGLDEPAVRATVTAANGTVRTLLIGNPVGMVDKGGYYVCVEGTKTIFLTQTLFYSAVTYSREDLLEMADYEIDTTTIKEISIKSTDGTVSITREEEAVTSGSGDTTASWLITGKDGESVTADGNKASVYISENYTSINFSKAVDYKEENQGDYGLDEPEYEVLVTCEGDDGRTQYRLIIGRHFSEDQWYACIEGDSRTYVMSDTIVQDLIDLNVLPDTE